MKPILYNWHGKIRAMLKACPYDLTESALYLQSLKMPEETQWASALEHMPQLGVLMLLLMVTLLSEALYAMHSCLCTQKCTPHSACSGCLRLTLS